MKAPFYIRPYRNATRPWLHYVGVERETRRKKFFETKTEAKRWEHFRNTDALRHGTKDAIDLELKAQALRCRKLLEPYGVTIVDAAVRLAAILEERKRSCTIPQLFGELKETKRAAGVGHDHLYRFGLLGKRLAERFPDKLVSDLETKDIEEFLAALPGKAPKTWNTQRTLLAIAFCFGKRRSYCSRNPAVDAHKAKEIERESVGILRPMEFANLLVSCSPEILVALVVAGFAGLRISEVCDLDWQDVHLQDEPDTNGAFGYIKVRAKTAKSFRNRFVPIESNLASWLRPFAKPSGRIIAMTQQRFNYLRRKAARAVGIDWPNTGLRHSYASYHYSHFKKLGDLQAAMGHTSVSLIRKNYREAVRPDVAAEYWEIAPSKIGISNILAFKPEGYWWFHKVGSLAEGEWISGVENFAQYFGAAFPTNVYKWFSRSGAPTLRDDGRFYIPTWRAFIEKELPAKNVAKMVDYVSWYDSKPKWRTGATAPERQYFESKAKAEEWAEECNRKLLVKELHLADVANVIEFSPEPQDQARECTEEENNARDQLTSA